MRIIRAVRFAAKLKRSGSSSSRRRGAPLVAVPRAAGRRAAEPPVRRDAQAAADRATRWRRSSSSRRWAWRRGIYPLLDLVVERAERALRARGACRTPTAASARASRSRRASCSPACCGPTCATAGRSGSRAGSTRSRRCRRRSTTCSTRASATSPAAASWRADMREIWMMQPRFEKRIGNTPFSLVEQPRFRAGFDFMRLRADVGRGRRGAGRLVAGVQPGQRRPCAKTWSRNCARSSTSGSAARAPRARRRCRAMRRDAIAARRRARPPRAASGAEPATARPATRRGSGGGGAASPPALAARGAARRGRARRRAVSGGRARRRSPRTSASAPISAIRRTRCERAIAASRALPHTALIARSSLYRTAPVDAERARLHQRGGRRSQTRLTAPRTAGAAAGARDARRPRAALSQRAAHAGPRPAAVRQRAHRERGADGAASAHARARLRAGAAGRDRAAAGHGFTTGGRRWSADRTSATVSRP